MSEAIASIASMLLATAAMSGLAMQTQRHISQVWSQERSAGGGIDRLPNRWIFRIAGSLLLLLAWAVCAREWGAGIATVMWCAALMCGATITVLLVTYRPRVLPVFGAVNAFCGVALYAFGHINY
jgi:hypothetical protein